MTSDDIAHLARKLWNSQILLYVVHDDRSATQIFEFQNDRGKDLTNLKAVKSFLMFGIYRSEAGGQADAISNVQNYFAEIYRVHEQIHHSGGPDEDSVLRYHLIGFEGWLRLPGDIRGWDRPKRWVKRALPNHDDKVGFLLG
jgi:hypothetical protein